MADHEVYYVKVAPELRFENGLFHVCYDIGQRRIEFVLRPSIYAATRDKGGRLLEEFERSGDVVPFGGSR